MIKKLLNISILLLIFLTSCNKEGAFNGFEEKPELETFSNTVHPFNSETKFVTTEGYTVLGDVLDIPYSVENLRKAFESLPYETKSGFTKDDIQPTHYYVKFSPKNEKELDILINISGLMLSEVPLDREVIMGGISYHDPELPLERPTYQYTTLDIGYWESLIDTLSVDAEILIEAYMPDYLHSTKSEVDYHLLPDKLYALLLKEACRMTGNEYDILPDTKSSGWTPTGRIRAYDNVVSGYVPIQDVVVRGTHLLRIEETTTNANGYFTLPSFNNSVSLKVVWEGDDWDVRDGNLGQAVYDGPTLSSGSWNLDISSTETASLNISAVFRAARRVYMGYNLNLTRPSNTRKEKIAYIHDEIAGVNGDYNRQAGAGIWSDIRIAGKNSSGWRLVSEIFSSTCHELGHAAHYTNATTNYTNGEQRVRESWARFHQYLCTIQEYTDLGVVSNLWSYNSLGIMIPDNQYNFQDYTSNSQYTPLFIDIYDSYNQHDYSSIYINDTVSGFPISSLEGVVYGNTSFAEIKQHFLGIVNTTGYMFGMTENSINELFSDYDD